MCVIDHEWRWLMEKPGRTDSHAREGAGWHVGITEYNVSPSGLGTKGLYRPSLAMIHSALASPRHSFQTDPHAWRMTRDCMGQHNNIIHTIWHNDYRYNCTYIIQTDRQTDVIHAWHTYIQTSKWRNDRMITKSWVSNKADKRIMSCTGWLSGSAHCWYHAWHVRSAKIPCILAKVVVNQPCSRLFFYWTAFSVCVHLAKYSVRPILFLSILPPTCFLLDNPKGLTTVF